jgi:hypothetical protein
LTKVRIEKKKSAAEKLPYIKYVSIGELLKSTGNNDLLSGKN